MAINTTLYTQTHDFSVIGIRSSKYHRSRPEHDVVGDPYRQIEFAIYFDKIQSEVSGSKSAKMAFYLLCGLPWHMKGGYYY